MMDFLDTIMSDVHSHSEGGQSVHKIKKGRTFNSGLVVNAQVSILVEQYWWRHCPESIVFLGGKDLPPVSLSQYLFLPGVLIENYQVKPGESCNTLCITFQGSNIAQGCFFLWKPLKKLVHVGLHFQYTCLSPFWFE